MSNPTLLVADLKQPVALRAAPAGGIVVALRRGELLTIDIATAAQSVSAAVAGAINTFALSPDGQTAYVAGDSLGLWRVPLAGEPPARLIRSVVRPSTVLVDAAGSTVLIGEGRARGRLLQLTLEPLQGEVRARGLTAACGMASDPATGRIIVAEGWGGGRLVEPQPTGPPIALVTGLGVLVDLDWHDPTRNRLLVADTAGGRILSIDLMHPTRPPVELYTGLIELRAAQRIGVDRIAFIAESSVFLAELPAANTDPVEMHVPEGLFISGWVRIPVSINNPAVKFDDLEFVVSPDDGGALVSYSRDNSFDPAKPSIVVSAGWRTGDHQLIARGRANGTELGRTAFTVLENWTDEKYGPSVATFGSIISGPDSGTWGGPDSGDFTVPQNVAVHPALGTRNVGVVLVETASMNGQYPTGPGLTTIVNNLRNELVNGVMVGGQTRSTAQYFDQASNGALRLNIAGPVGPVALPNNWNSYFRMDGSQWVLEEEVDTTVIAEIVRRNETAIALGNPPFLDLSQLDTIIYIFRSVDNPAPDVDLFVWPRASLTSKLHIIGTRPEGGFRIPLFRGIARVSMPDVWAGQRGAGNRRFHETVAHELCHNFGLVDQYDQGYRTEIADRITSQKPPDPARRWSWELMAFEEDLPLPSAAHRLMLGWINPAHVRLYNFGINGPIDELITLQAATAGPPADGSGRYALAEVRLEDGKNFYFEYRPAVAGRIVDSNSPEANAVFATEALTRLPAPIDRAQILLVSEDNDGIVEQGSFIAGQDFRERDTTTPAFEQDFIVDVVTTSADHATIRVRYAADNKPDPGLTPWSAARNWQSPDIEVENGRSLADPDFRNVPWEGHDNTVIAKVSNHGTSDAHGVIVLFFAKDFTFGGGVEIPLGIAISDVPRGASVKLRSSNVWRPQQIVNPHFDWFYPQHACVGARFDPFFDAVTGLWEVTPENDEAQSNFTWMASSTASPASREVTTILAENPFDAPAIISFSIWQPNPLFRVFLSHRWVRLAPGEQYRVLLMVESLLGDPRYEADVEQYEHGERRITTKVRLSALGDTGETCTQAVIGGVSVLAMTGIGTSFEHFEVGSLGGGGSARGRIVQTDNGSGVDGRVLVTVLPLDPDDPRPEIVVETEAVAGDFVVELGHAHEGGRFQACYLGRYPWGPCESREIEL